jgi:hypothetical protein
MAHPVVTATLSVQGISTEVDVTDATQRFWLNGILFGNPVAQGAYNDSSHLTEADDSNDVVVRNVKWFGTSQAEVDTILLSAYGSALYGEDQFGGTRANSNPVVIGLPLSQPSVNSTSISLRIFRLRFQRLTSMPTMGSTTRVPIRASRSTQPKPVRQLRGSQLMAPHRL